jgi:hypothetical protein
MTAISRRAALGAFVALGLASTSCFGPKSQPLTPEQIMQKSGDALKTVKTVHFTLSSTNGMMSIGTGLVAKSIDGDIQQPDRLKASATGTFGRVTVNIGLIQVGTRQYITNPITKQWQELPGPSAAPNLLDPDRGAPAILKQATQLKQLPNESIQGTDCYHVSGKIPAAPIAGLVGTTTTATTLDGEVWVGTQDFLPRQISLAGPLTTNEPANISRLLALSNFNESISIEAPTA